MIRYEILVRDYHIVVRTQNFPKNYNFLQLTGTRTCAYQGVRNLSFPENLCTY